MAVEPLELESRRREGNTKHERILRVDDRLSLRRLG
jgi:hypothetical protein